jgi:tetratricopeptide (TPR) repeat protein
MTLQIALLFKLAGWIPAMQFTAGGPPSVASGLGVGLDAMAAVKWIVLAVVVLGSIWILRRMLGSGGHQLKAKVSRGARSEILRRARGGDYRGAGDLAFGEQAFEDAAEYYVKAGDFGRAAEAFAAGGHRKEAIQHFKRAGQPQRAAELYEAARQYRPAANEYLACGAKDKAAALFLQTADFRRAGEIYLELQRRGDAGEAFERLGEREKAAELFEQYFEQEHQLVRGDVSRLSDVVRSRARFAAECAEQGGHLSRAARLRERSGYTVEAAETYARAGMAEEAARLYVASGRPMLAAELYEERGDEERAAQYRAEGALIRGETEEAAELFITAREPLRAANLYVDLGEHVKAAVCFESAGDHRSEAEQYGLEERFNDAAIAYEKAGDYFRAYDLYQQIDDMGGRLRCLDKMAAFFELGRLLLSEGKEEDALRELQRVEVMDPKYQSACELQGDILTHQGEQAGALGKYRLAIEDAVPDAHNLSLFYKTGVCLEVCGRPGSALEIFEQVQAVDFFYEDIQSRVEALRGSQEPAVEQSTRLAVPSPPISRNTTGLSRRADVRKVVASPGGENRYEVLEEVARGGMGIVFKATDTVLNRVVAYKVLSEHLKGNPTAVKYFIREARAAAALSHPNLVTVFDAGEQEGDYYMAMEFVEGETLKTLVSRAGPFREQLVRFIAVHASRGLAYAHGRGLVHRDIKSSNVMLTADKSLKIMDFGLAKFIEEYQGTSSKAVGTPYYMSPEQIMGRKVDQRADLYSLGVTLFECATGTVPFFKGDLAYHHLHTPAPSPRALNPSLSEGIDEIILRLLEKKPEHRFQSATEVMTAVRSG